MRTLEPATRKWSKREYHEAAELGWFDAQSVELIDGEVITTAPQRDEHAMSLTLSLEAIRRAFGPSFTYRVQMPFNVSSSSEPEPDLLVVRGLPRSIKKHPTTAALIIEISDTTLAHDRGRKASLYASRGVRDYWVVNLVARVAEVRRKAVVDPDAPFGHSYSETVVFRGGQSISPLAARKAKVRVIDLLP